MGLDCAGPDHTCTQYQECVATGSWAKLILDICDGDKHFNHSFQPSSDIPDVTAPPCILGPEALPRAPLPVCWAASARLLHIGGAGEAEDDCLGDLSLGAAVVTAEADSDTAITAEADSAAATLTADVATIAVVTAKLAPTATAQQVQLKQYLVWQVQQQLQQPSNIG